MNAIIFFGAEPKNEKFNLTFKKTENTLNFKYVNHIDTTKTIAINKIIDADTLLFGFDKFVKTSKKPFTNDELQGLVFDYYDTLDYADDATGPILFSEKYGLLAINNVYGPTIIFLDKKNDYLTEHIIDNLNE
ncbi:hypothetical protein [Galbibacter mesophilus]|uniref:hypothetical protein n=1 Tax=Galbibacter mesophilus TaxID=379069 RepID=UPI00191CC02A|nr:hypothetical protein [Galbibacter mesophilus]MCM5662139.1 hypothetical protein [Galbibacter mesophilus]